MMRSARLCTLVLTASFLSSCGSPPEPDATEAQSAGLDAADMLGYLESKIDIAEDKFIQLAEAVPEESYDWRPMEGVRSFREIFLHIAADNWYGGALMDVPTPEDIPVTGDGETVGAYQEQVLSKAETLEHLRRSFTYFSGALDATRGHLDTPAMLRMTELTYGDLWVRLVTHMHEHLGQTIAYARANEIVPPWSR